MIEHKFINPCKEIIADVTLDYSAFDTVGTYTRTVRNDPKCRGMKKLSNLSDEQYQWVNDQAAQFDTIDGKIYAPDYGSGFFGRDIWVSQKMCEWFILHYGTDHPEGGHTESLQKMYDYISKAMTKEMDKDILKSYYETESKSK